MRKTILFALAFSVFVLMINYASASTVYDPPNDTYTWEWQAHGPRIDELYFKIYETPEAELAAMQAGEVQACRLGARDEAAGTLYSEGYTIIPAPRLLHYQLGFNMRKWPFMQDATGNAFRHATAHLVPKDDVIAELYPDAWEPSYQGDNFVPASLGYWFNPNIDKHSYSIDEAVSILSVAGYTFVDNTPTQGVPSSVVSAGPEDYWLTSNGTQLPEIKVFSPLFEVAPSYYAWANMTVERMQMAGLTSVVQEPMDFTTYVHLVMRDHDFDMYVVGWAIPDDPRYLYSFFHSSQDFSDGYNLDGVHDSALDAELEVIRLSLNLTERKNAVVNAETILSELLPHVPIPSSHGIYALDPNLDGIVNTYHDGADNQWTFLNIHRQGIPVGGTLNWTFTGPRPPNISPVHGMGVVNERIFDGLLAKNPETKELMPWIAANWNIEPWIAPGNIPGMNVTFWLRDDVYWQDNVQFTAEDVKFALEYIQKYYCDPIPPSGWKERDLIFNLVEVVIPPANPYVVKVYFNSTKYWVLNDVARAASVFPKHIWESVTEPYQFEPWAEPHPTVPGLTKLIGTGPFYLVEYVLNDHFLLRANSNYFQKLPTSTSEEVGSSGGTVSNVAGTASVDIPSGALTENTTISIEEYPTSEYGGFLINQSDSIVSYGVYEFGPAGTTFDTNVTIALTYNETAVDESQLEQLVVYSSDDGVNWYQVTIQSVDTVENTITIEVDHFSLFALLSPTISGVVVDEYTGQPIEGVTISLLETDTSTVTDALGSYSLNVGHGNYTVEMTLPYGFLTHDAVTKFIDTTITEVVDFTAYQASWSDATVPRTIGYWKHWDKHYTSDLMQTFIGQVKNASGLFSDLTIANIDASFKITRHSTMETKAQAQLLASWLNVVSAQLGVDVQVDVTAIFGWETIIADDDGFLTVDELLSQIDTYYVTNADLTAEQGEHLKDILDALNNGQLFTI